MKSPQTSPALGNVLKGDPGIAAAGASENDETQKRGLGGLVFLTAPKDLQQTLAYERWLGRLTDRHGEEAVIADRDLFSDTLDWRARWKEVYGRARRLYVLVRADGTVGLGIWKQTRWLRKLDVPAVVVVGDPPGVDLAGLGGPETVEHEVEHEDFDLIRLELKTASCAEDFVRFARVNLGTEAEQSLWGLSPVTGGSEVD